MATYKITAPDGNAYNVTAPDTASKDEVLAYAKKNYKGASGGSDWKGVVGSAVNSAFMKPGTVPNKLMVPSLANAPAQAKALPPLASLAGGIMGGPMGATKFGEGGRALSDAALASYGMKDQIPSLMSHAGELAGNVFGDVVAFPKAKKAYYGSQIGKSESANPGLKDVVKEAPPSGPRTAVKFAQQLKGQDLTPLEAKRFQPAMSAIYKKGIPFQGALKQYAPDFMEANRSVSSGLNKIPGRLAPSEKMAEAMKVPNFVRDNIQTVWQNPVLRKLIYAALTGMGIGEGANLTLRR